MQPLVLRLEQRPGGSILSPVLAVEVLRPKACSQQEMVFRLRQRPAVSENIDAPRMAFRLRSAPLFQSEQPPNGLTLSPDLEISPVKFRSQQGLALEQRLVGSGDIAAFRMQQQGIGPAF